MKKNLCVNRAEWNFIITPLGNKIMVGFDRDSKCSSIIVKSLMRNCPRQGDPKCKDNSGGRRHYYCIVRPALLRLAILHAIQ